MSRPLRDGKTFEVFAVPSKNGWRLLGDDFKPIATIPFSVVKAIESGAAITEAEYEAETWGDWGREWQRQQVNRIKGSAYAPSDQWRRKMNSIALGMARRVKFNNSRKTRPRPSTWDAWGADARRYLVQHMRRKRRQNDEWTKWADNKATAARHRAWWREDQRRQAEAVSGSTGVSVRT